MAFNDEDRLRRLEKAFSQKADTGTERQPWQELLDRYAPAPTEKVSQAAEVVAGLAGSWTAFYARDLGLRDGTTSQGIVPVQNKVLKLGQPGVPEVNFVPYSHHTNRFGNKGPSLLGHPISFSVVGPTLKSPALDIQWQVTDNSGSPGVGDVLTIDTRSVLSPKAWIPATIGPVSFADLDPDTIGNDAGLPWSGFDIGPGDSVIITGSASNDGTYLVDSLATTSQPDDTLVLDIGETLVNEAASPAVTIQKIPISPKTSTIADTYGFSDLVPFPGGLYLVVSQTGSQGLLDDGGGGTVTGGLGDGYVLNAGSPAIAPITPNDATSKFEIFRVVAVGANTLTLDHTKRLATYFTVPGQPALRAVTLLEPQATRLMAIPGSGGGVGQERAFVVVPPERTANSDMMPPLGAATVPHTPADGTWRGGGVEYLEPHNSLSQITVTDPGEGYLPNALITLSAPEYPGGVQATAKVLTTTSGPPGPVDIISITEPGSGYLAPPTVTFALPTAITGEVTIPTPLPDGIATAFTMNTAVFPIEPGTLTLTVLRLTFPFVAVDDGAGGWVPDANITAGSINYATGAIAITYFGAPDSTPPPNPFTLDYTPQRATGTSDIAPTLDPGTSANYGEKALTPIPVPLSVKRAITGDTAFNPAVESGTMAVILAAADVDTADLGRLIHLYSVRQDGVSDLKVLSQGQVARSALLGWFEVISVNVPSSYYRLKRLPEVDPVTGRIFYGSYEALELDNDSNPSDEMVLEFTVHEPVSSLYTGAHAIDKIEASRLTNLIDPSWVERSAKETTVIPGGKPQRPDRAIFETSSSGGGAAGTNADPGSLLDLGFRMVLYPATPGTFAGEVAPDWDKPILSQNVVLDPSLSVSQCLEVDYASGLVLLSHDPVPGAGCDVAPNGLIAIGPSEDNPRGEIVLFASCVPYSREEGQAGSGMRILSEVSGSTGGQDVFGERVTVPLEQTLDPIALFFRSGVNQRLDIPFEEGKMLPLTGFIDLLNRDATLEGNPKLTSPIGTRATTFGYYAKEFFLDSVSQENKFRLRIYGGAVEGALIAPSLGGKGDEFVALRRDIVTPNDLEGVAGANYEYDTTSGFAKRPRRLRVQEGAVTAEPDGSTSLSFPKLADHEALFDELFSSWLISGGNVSPTGIVSISLGVEQISFDALTVLINGIRTVLPASRNVAALSATTYVYVDSTYPSQPIILGTGSLPLSNPDDVLLAAVTADGAGITSIQDLRNPLTNLDRRLDILVGQTDGHSAQDTHFDTLRDAINYVGEIMDPTTGADGSYLRIKVVGYTIEDETAGPIVLPADGVIVEGAAKRLGLGGIRVQDFGAGNSIIDMNSKTGWVWRDLHFENIQTPGSIVDNDPLRGTLFTGSSILFRFENVSLDGNNQMMGFMDSSFLVNCTLRDLQIDAVTDFGIYVTNGEAIRVVDSVFTKTVVLRGVTATPVVGENPTSSPVPNGALTGPFLMNANPGNLLSANTPIVPSSVTLTIDIAATPSVATDDGAGNITGLDISSGTINYATGAISVTYSTAPDGPPFILDYTYQVPVLDAPAGVHFPDGSGAGDGADISVRGCTFDGHFIGIDSQASNAKFESNTIVNSDSYAIQIRTHDSQPSRTWINNNHLNQVGTYVGTGIRTGPSTDHVHLVGNDLTLGTIVSTEWGISVEGTETFVRGNRIFTDKPISPVQLLGGLQITGDDNLIEGNNVRPDEEFGVIDVSGNNCVVTGNRCYDITVSGTDGVVGNNNCTNDLTASNIDITVADNRVDNIITVSGNECTATGNRCDTLTVSGDSCVVANNIVTNDLSNTGGAGTSVVLQGNNIGGDLILDRPAAAATGNIIGNDVTTSGTASNAGILSNRVGNDITIGSANAVIEGNTVVNDITLAGSGHVVNGNRVTGEINGTTLTGVADISGNTVVAGAAQGIRISNSADQSVIASNFLTQGEIVTNQAANVQVIGNTVGRVGGAGGFITLDGDNSLVSGNRCWSVSISGASNGDGSVITSNVADATISVGISGAVVDLTISNNHLTAANGGGGEILINDGCIDYVMVGNRAVNVRNPAGTTLDPDVSNGILVGNRVSGSIFGVAGPHGGPAKDNNR